MTDHSNGAESSWPKAGTEKSYKSMHLQGDRATTHA